VDRYATLDRYATGCRCATVRPGEHSRTQRVV